eukprot:scaffold8968_cov57-Phaeocystis_antarctica.AAC.8
MAAARSATGAGAAAKSEVTSCLAWGTGERRGGGRGEREGGDELLVAWGTTPSPLAASASRSAASLPSSGEVRSSAPPAAHVGAATRGRRSSQPLAATADHASPSSCQPSPSW